MYRRLTRASTMFSLLGVALLAACSPGGDDADSAMADSGVATTTAGTDTGMAGMNHATMGDMANRGPAKDANHEFLRMMSDHHAGLIAMASAAMTKASNAQTQTDAHALHTKQEKENQDMVAMVQRDYGERLTPQVMPSNKVMNDTLQSKTGPDYDRTFYGSMVRHHQDGIKMIDDFMPRLTNPAVKQMAARMKADQQKEITDFQQKQGRVGPGA